jgi:hypothetical protein
MVKCCVFFAVRTEFLNIIWTSFGFKEIILRLYLLLYGKVNRQITELKSLTFDKNCAKNKLKIRNKILITSEDWKLKYVKFSLRQKR